MHSTMALPASQASEEPKSLEIETLHLQDCVSTLNTLISSFGG